MLVLGIETTCDETAASVVRSRDSGCGDILSNEVMSQIAQHAVQRDDEIAERVDHRAVEVDDRGVEAGKIEAQASGR